MSYNIRKYVLGRQRLSRALREGFTLTEDGGLAADGGCLSRHCLFSRLDSATPGCPWGRLAFRAQLQEEMVLRVRAFASDDAEIIRGGEAVSTDGFLLDPAVPLHRKEQLFGLAGGVEYAGHREVLFYGQKGRYLWIWVELDGPGRAELGDFRVYVPGDSFFGTFPEVYRTDGEFLHRYLSIFSTLFYDLQEEIDRLPACVDVDTAPAEVLPVLAGWLGLELEGGGLRGEELRRLLKAAFPLIAAKGTRRAVEGVVKLFVDEPVYIVERNLLEDGAAPGAQALYGESPYDFAVLLDCPSEEGLRARLRFFIEQFKPIRSRVKIVFLGDCGGLDAFTYLDVNGAVATGEPAGLDDGTAMVGVLRLQ